MKRNFKKKTHPASACVCVNIYVRYLFLCAQIYAPVCVVTLVATAHHKTTPFKGDEDRREGSYLPLTGRME